MVQQFLLLLLLAGLGGVLLWPIWLTIRGGITDTHGKFSLGALGIVFQDPTLRAGLVNSALIAIATTTIALVLSFPLALLSARYTFPGKRVWNALVLVPLILPPFVGAIGVRHLMGRFGAINSAMGTEYDFLGQARFWGVVAVEALHLYPVLYLNILAAIANLDPTLDEVARNLGAGSWTRLRRVMLPLIRPGVFAGATIVFIWSFTELGAPLMFDYYRVTPVQIFARINSMENSTQPYALTAVMLLAAVLFYLIGKLIAGGPGYAMYSRASVQSEEVPLHGWAGLGASSVFLLAIIPAILPHAGVIVSSFSANGAWYRSILPSSWTLGHYADALSHPLATGSILNSLKYASIAMAITVVLGTVVAYLVVRTRILGRTALDSLSMLPLAVPGLVMAFGYVAMTLHYPFNLTAQTAHTTVEKWLVPVVSQFDVLGPAANPLILLVIAYTVRRLPFMVRSISAGLEQSSVELEEAARNLGAGPIRALKDITVPLITANIIAGGLLVFSFSMLEVSDSLILAQRETHFPMTKAIYTLYQRLGDGEYIASAMGVWGMVLLGLTLIGASLLLGKKAGALFRA